MVDNVDKKILFELERNSRIPDTQLAKLVRKSKDAVRYRIKKFEEEKIIKNYKTWIDYSKLGFRTATIYLTIMNFPEKKKELIDSLKKDSRVYWYGIAEGVWNVGITYFIKSNNDLFEIKNELLTKHKGLIIDMKFTSLASVSASEKSFLVNSKAKFVTFTEDIENNRLDGVGEKVLKELYWNSKINLAELSFRCKSSVDIVRKRMRDFEKLGIIVRYTVEIDYSKLGYTLYKAFIYLGSYTKKELQGIMDYCEGSKKIINVVKQIALWDLELIIFAESFEDYTKVINDLTEIYPKLFKKIETAIMSKDVIFPCKEVGF